MNAQDVRDNLNAALNQHRALTQVSAMLDEIVSFEQATTEAKDARDKAVAERDIALVATKQATDDLAKAKAALAAVDAKATGITDDATAAADAIMTDAQYQASVIVNGANDRASEIDARLATSRATLDDVQAAVGMARGELSDLSAKIAAVKDQFRSLVS